MASNWWANKLGQTQPQSGPVFRGPAVPLQAPPSPPAAVVQQAPGQQYQQPTPKFTNFSEAMAAMGSGFIPQPTHADSAARLEGTKCPACGGEYYFTQAGGGMNYSRCMGCGHNSRFQQRSG